MITPSQIRKKALVAWNSGSFLASCIDGSNIFPITIRFRTPSGKELLNSYDDVRKWILTLRESSKEFKADGYEIVWQTIQHRNLGDQQLPRQIIFSTPADWLAYINKKTEHRAFLKMANQTRSALPDLLPYLVDKPLKALVHAAHWTKILSVCEWFKNHPRPGKYIRQLDIAGIDTKFIETNTALLMDLLPLVLEMKDVDVAITGLAKHGFERKFGLQYDQPLVRLRLLDPSLVISGFSDVSIPLAELARIDPGAKTVFITENKINGLSFPPFKQAMVIFGLGYGAEMLPEIKWLSEKEIFYWGDIDTHGFAILSQIRGHFPQIRSFLMDRATLLAHQSLWGAETPGKRFTGILAHLTQKELDLFSDLKQNRLGPHLRLEQERIRFSFLLDALRRLPG